MIKFLVCQQGPRTHGKQQANSGGKQPTFCTVRAQRTVRPHRHSAITHLWVPLQAQGLSAVQKALRLVI